MTPLLPLVSVGIPTYRGERFIAAAIESVLRQSLGDFELIVIDDGSLDATEAIVRGYADPRLQYLRNERNLGPQPSWNRCLELARGRYFKLLPHDDLLHPQCLERQVAVLEADLDQEIALVSCTRDVLAPDGRVLMQRGYPGASQGRIGRVSAMRACVRRGTNVLGEPGALLFRTDLARRVGPFDATNPYVIDLDYWFRLMAHGDLYHCAEALAGFRVSEGSWSVALGASQSQDFRRFVRRMSDKGLFPSTALDRLCALLLPTLNNLARLAFYRLYLK